MSDARLDEALGRWRAALGTADVVTDPATLAAWHRATFATRQQVPAILRPGSSAEVQACVRIANACRVPVYPVSRGRNWGLGSRVPPQDGCVALDLSRMDRIVDFDEKLGCLTLEPGVTFRQAREFLQHQGSRRLPPEIGGSADASVLANALERGDAVGPYGERAEHVAALQVVLPTGELAATGFGRFAGASCARLNRHGVGPSLDGLFMQSNLGIVTQLTVWLPVRPAVELKFACRLAEPMLAQAIDVLQDLFARGVLQPGSFTLWNVYKLLAREGRYPWRVCDGRTPLSLRSQGREEPWFVSGSVSGASVEHAESLRALLEPALSALGSAPSFATAHTADEVPDERNLRTAYWRKRSPVPSELDLDRDCGLIWLCPALPFDGRSAGQAFAIAREFAEAHGFEAQIGASAYSPRSLNCYVSLAYDREVPGEDARAMECHDRLLERLLAAGHFPYRLGIHSMRALPAAHDDADALLRRLKQVLDPNGILAPGRYQPD